jgi:putative transposase
MAQRRPSIPIADTLRNLFPDTLLASSARDTGVVQRQRKVDPVTLFWVVVCGFTVGGERTLAGLRRAYHRVAEELAPSSFYKRFTPALAEFFRRGVLHALEQFGLDCGLALKGPFASFRDLILLDASVIHLQDVLCDVFRGTRRTAPAAAKLHVVLGVRGVGRSSVQVTGERTPEQRTVTIDDWVNGHLLIFDLGYFAYPLFHAIVAHGGYFLSRLKRHINLPIAAVHTPGHERSLNRPLREAVATWTAPFVDLELAVPTRRTPWGRYTAAETRRLRVVAVRRTDAEIYDLYLTNIEPTRLSAEEVRAVYASRWHIELVFKEWKHHYRLSDLPSAKREIVESLLYATVLTLVVSHRLADEVRRRLGALSSRIRALRWAALFEAIAPDLLIVMTRPRAESRVVEQSLRRAVLAEAIDPNAGRKSLLASIEHRKHQYAHSPRIIGKACNSLA